MERSNGQSPALPDASPAAKCPACDSSTTVTTAKHPDANSYWRCESCGNVWNVSRSNQSRPDQYRRRAWG